jgi:glucan phosphoethanolaminetransferase (alkaline phosphatase superfamily)
MFIFIKIANKLGKNRIIYNKSKYLLLLFIIIPIINTAIHYKKRGLGDRPNTNKSIMKNGLYVTKAFFGKTLPLYLFNIQIVKPYQNKDFKNSNNQNQAKNVILIVGESLSLHYMSLYGYDKDTTPNLKRLQKDDKNFIAFKAISGGVFTDSSVPMLLNVEKQPNALNHILTNKTNLFKLAKDNGYKTHWISAQANDSFSYIRSYMGLKYIDNYTDSLKYGFDKYTSSLDDVLLKELKHIDFSKRNFIVLNMIGSHEPYETRVIKTFKPFGNSNHLDNYCNTVAYTDLILNDIIKFVKKQNKEIIFIFTSDHGQHVTKQSLGKGNLKDIRDYQVPAIFYSHNINIGNEVSTILNTKEYNSHYNIGLITAYYLGYKTLDYIDLNKAYINGNELSGNSGFCEYNLKTNKQVIK